MIPSLTPTSLLEAAAARRTDGDPWAVAPMEALTTLVESVARDADLSTTGRRLFANEVIQLLVSRCRILELQGQGRLPEHPIDRPVIIVGLPRTGSTLLHRLLAVDPASRALACWEALKPVPLSDDDAADDVELRRRIVRVGLRTLDLLSPTATALHPMGVDDPEECPALMAQDFTSPQFVVEYHAPGYLDWYCEQDASPWYRSLRRMLGWFPRADGSRWVLKSPFHLVHPEALVAAFPDAVLVQLHRDPIDVLPSWCALLASGRQVCSRRVEPHQIGEETVAIWQTALQRWTTWRTSVRPEVVDIHYQDLVREPMAAVDLIYRRAGRVLSADAEATMHDWLDERHHGRVAPGHQPIGYWGLSEELIGERFDGLLAEPAGASALG